MNLKEAFRYQNKLNALLQTAQNYLSDPSYTTQVKEIHLRSKVDPLASDDIQYKAAPQDAVSPAGQDDDPLHAVPFGHQGAADLRYPCSQKQQVFDLDGASALNVQRQEAARTLRYLAGLRSSEEMIPSGGTGYRFNQEGNQVAYCCDLKRVTTINYDRTAVRKAAAQLAQEADETSAAIDRCLIDTIVAFEPPFDVNATFAELLEDYAAMNA